MKIQITVISQAADDEKNEKTSILPRKKKCALLLSYCGAGYNGMQMYVSLHGVDDQEKNYNFVRHTRFNLYWRLPCIADATGPSFFFF